MKIIFDYNRTIFNPETEALYEGAFDILNDLSREHDLYLVSANEPGRRERIKDFGIHKLFKKIIFVNHKSVEIFKLIANEGEDVFVVGDNIYGEINIGNKMNFTTVWVKQGKFSNLLSKAKEHEPNYTIGDMRELMNILKK